MKEATKEENMLPSTYFSDVEMHQGGCGTFEWTKKWATATRFALGIAFHTRRQVEAGKEGKISIPTQEKCIIMFRHEYIKRNNEE